MIAVMTAGFIEALGGTSWALGEVKHGVAPAMTDV